MCHALVSLCWSAGYRGANCLPLIGSSYDDVCPDLVHVLIAERICFSAGVEEARDSATRFSSLMQNINCLQTSLAQGGTT